MPISNAEQMQIAKSWWREYGSYVLFSVIAFMLFNFGWRYWQQYKQARLEQASVAYTQMLTAIEQKKTEEVKLFGERLIANYSRYPYASFAAFMLAKDAVQNNDLPAAVEKLRFVVKKSSNKTLRQLANIRVARVLLAMKKPEEALKQLTHVYDKAYLVEINEATGDSYLALGKVAEAEKAYNKAKDSSAVSPLIKMKLLQF